MDLSCDTAKLLWSQKTAERHTGSALQSGKSDDTLPVPVGSGHRTLYQVSKPALEAALITSLTLMYVPLLWEKEFVHLLKLDSKTSLVL